MFSLPIQRVFLLSASSMSWLLATAALVGAVPAPNFGASVWQSHAPQPNELVVAVDLDLCSNKATFTNNRCPSATGQRLDHEHVVECRHVWLVLSMHEHSISMLIFEGGAWESTQDTRVACWSSNSTSDWWCLGKAMAGPRAASGLPWDVACAAESYAGACAYGTGLALSK